MKKAEVKITIRRIIDLNPEIYGPDATPESMLADEIRYAEELPHEWMDADNVEWKTEAWLINEGEESK
ncbi:hypothetical protein HMSSN036_51880 [Paenibacillus macerans]|nr:hypothetical protein HMSSN036_51880 [Paenibacillus macerans]